MLFPIDYVADNTDKPVSECCDNYQTVIIILVLQQQCRYGGLGTYNIYTNFNLKEKSTQTIQSICEVKLII